MSGLRLLGIGRSALLTAANGLGVTGRNIANAATPGYSRIRMTLSTLIPGGGVQSLGIEAFRDRFLMARMRGTESSLGGAQARAEMLARLEDLLQGSDGAPVLAKDLDGFYNAFSDLASRPEGMPERSSVRGSASTLVADLHALANGLQNLKNEADQRLGLALKNVDSTLDEIAGLNREIGLAAGATEDVSALLDRRDLLLKGLSAKLPIEVTDSRDGMVEVRLSGGGTLVRGADVVGTLSLGTGAGGTAEVLYGEAAGAEVRITGLLTRGEIGGLLAFRDGDLTDAGTALDALAAKLVTEVNALHAPGVNPNGTSNNFFLSTGLAAGSIGLDPLVLADLNNIAAGSTADPGDNRVALAIASLAGEPLFGGPPPTQGFNEFAGSISSDMGSRARDASDEFDQEQSLLSALEQRREEIAGVSLDEEGTFLLEFQRSYQASSRFIAAVDSTIESTLALL